MIDTHAHLNFQAFADDWQVVLARAQAVGVDQIILVGADIDTSTRAVELSEQSPALSTAVGIHPHHAKKYLSQNLELKSDLHQLEELISKPRVVAVGEIGLDYHLYSTSQKYETVAISPELVEIQKQLFTAQLELAHRHHKPVIIHSRKTKTEVLDELIAFNQTHSPPLKGVFHCFEGGKKMAARVVAAGFYLGFAGNLTYEQGKDEVAKTVPLDRLLLETDCPYMIPVPERKLDQMVRCEPRHVEVIGRFHAKIRNLPAQEVFAQTTQNAKTLFGI